MPTVKFPYNLHPHQAQQGPWLRKSAVPAIAAAVLAVALYAVTLGGTYVYDDVQIVQNDPRVRHPDQWTRLWKTDYFDGGMDNLYRPIVSSSYAVEWWLHGDRPWVFHFVNILAHALAAASIAEFTRRVLRTTAIANSAALSAGLLFAAHPVHVEAVANIVGRAELFCTTGMFAGLILLCHRPLSLQRVMAVFTTGAIAVLCKEQGILQPLLWLLFGVIIWRSIKSSNARPTNTDPASRERQAVKMMVLITSWTWAAYLIIREHFLKFEWDRTYIDPIIQPLIRSHGSDRVLMPIVLLGHYTALLLYPVHLAADYGGDVFGSVAHLSDPFLWIGFVSIFTWIVMLLVCVTKIKTRRHGDTEKKNPASSPCLRVSVFKKSPEKAVQLVLFCLLSLAITYGMIGNTLTLLATNFAERLMYLPSAFFIIIIAILISHIPFKPRSLLLILLLSAASIRTATAARNWNHPLILFKTGLENQPKSAQLRLLLSQQYHQAGNIQAANAELREVCRQYPAYWRSWLFRALEDLDDGNLPDADMSLKRAIDLKADPQLIGVRDRLFTLHAATQPTAK